MSLPHAPKILVSWYCAPSYIPAFQLSPHQVTVGPRSPSGEGVYHAFTPFRIPYDLYSVVRAQGITEQFDAVIVFGDSNLANQAHNVAAFQCPTILFLGDTHHCDRPLQRMLAYALNEKFDFVVSSYNRQHLHWFQEAGKQNVAWIPGLVAKHVPRPLQTRERQIGFVGQIDEFHPRREPALRALCESGMLVKAGLATRHQSADLYAESVLSFNPVLNGDVNLRNFEITSAGGCLLTERLSPESGWPLLLKEGKEYVGYDSIPELVRQAEYYLKRPEEALEIARAGHAAYLDRFLPDVPNQKLLDWIFRQKTPEFNQPGWDYRPQVAADHPLLLLVRVQLYEVVQEAHRVQEELRILIAPGTPLSVVADLMDLHRARLFLLDASAAQRQALQQFGLAKRVSHIDWKKAVELANWSFLITDIENQAVRQIPHSKLILLPPSQQQSNAA